MFPAANVASVAAKPVQIAPTQTAQKTTQPQAPETARASAGEAAAANVRTETSKAVQAAEQSSVAPRLRDRETAERTDRSPPHKDAPTGPPPSFQESPLERQARVAFDPPDIHIAQEHVEDDLPATETELEADAFEKPTAFKDPPPTPTERAEVSFAETQTLAEAHGPPNVDVRT